MKLHFRGKQSPLVPNHSRLLERPHHHNHHHKNKNKNKKGHHNKHHSSSSNPSKHHRRMETLPENDSEDSSVVDRNSSTARLTSNTNNNSGESSASDSGEEGIVVHFGDKRRNEAQPVDATLEFVPSLPGFDENSPQLSRYDNKAVVDRKETDDLSLRDKIGLDEAKKWRTYTIQSETGEGVAANEPPPVTEDSVIDIPDVVTPDSINVETKF